MRDGVLIADIQSAGQSVKLATQMYADSHALYRGHLTGFEQTRKMTDALAGRTTLSIAALSVHNQNQARDAGLISGTADIRIGSLEQSPAQMDAVLLDAPVAQVARTDNEISVAVLDGQARGQTAQQRIYDTSGDGFGALLPEVWGNAERFPLIKLDGDTGKVFGCAGPLTSISAVYVDEAKQSSGFVNSISGTTATVTFTTKPDGPVFIDAVGLGSSLPGALLNALLTRIAPVVQGNPVASSANSVTLDARVDDATATLVGKTITIYREAGNESKSISGYDGLTRIVTISGSWSTNPAVDDIYSIEVDTAAGGFTSAQVDNSGFDQLDIDLPYTFGLIASRGIDAIKLQDKLLKPLLCHLAPRRDGVVQLKRLSPAAGSPVASITRIIGEVDRRPMPIYWHVEVRYRADNSGGHYRSASAMDASIKAAYPDAKTISIDAPVQEVAGATAIAQHWLTCFGAPTEMAVMQVDHDLTALELGEVVEVFDERYQFAGGKLAVVAGMVDRFDAHDELTVWVGML